METHITVKTIGYYLRELNMNAVPDVKPKKINSNRICLDSMNVKIPLINLNVKRIDLGKGEVKLESILDYISQKGWPDGVRPDFVTNKQLLVYVASHNYPSRIYAFQTGGVVYMSKTDDHKPSYFSISEVFKHFYTKCDDEEPIEKEDGTVRKAVLKATVPGGHSIFYSGAVSAINENLQHYNFKLVPSTNQKAISCYDFWKLIFGNISYNIIGKTSSRLHNLRSEEKVFIEKIEMTEKSDFYPNAVSWTVQNGEMHLQKFLDLVKEAVKKDGDCFVFEKKWRDSEWDVSRDDATVGEFRDAILQSLNK